MSPMLARTYGPKFSHYPCCVQPKLNGVRALYSDGTFQSRDEKLWNPKVLSHLSEQLRAISGLSGLILDGELYRHGWRLQRINGAIAVNRKEPVADTLEVEYHVFDAINPHAANEDFTSRFSTLEFAASMRFPSHVKLVTTHYHQWHVPPQEQFDKFVSQGYEGLMLRPDGPYEPGKRSKFLYKWKSWEDGEFVCVGVEQGQGKASIGVGALKLSCTKFDKPAMTGLHFNCGTGFTDEERSELAKNPPIGRLVRVRYPYLSADGIPQCPSFLAVM